MTVRNTWITLGDLTVGAVVLQGNDGRAATTRRQRRGATWGKHRRWAAVGALAAALATGAGAAAPTAEASATGVAAAGPALPYIVQATVGDLAAAKHDVVADGGRVGVDLSIINGFAAELPSAALPALRADANVRDITLDAATSVQGSTYYPYTDAGGPVGLSSDIGYNAYWNVGYAGQGVGVALLDSGVVPVAALSAPGKVIYGPDFTPTGYFPQVRGLDTFGHGTFMAGLIAGRDPRATAPYWAGSGYFLGVAPDAHIVSVKVADASGATMESAVIAGIQWIVAHRSDPGLNIRVLNLSLGVRDGLAYRHDPLDAAAEAAWKAGITVVAAAGNDGRTGLVAPANDPYVIAVAAIDTGSTISVSDDVVASFSDLGDGTRNPDFGTLGTHIVSLRDPGSAIDQEYGSGPGSINRELMRGSGTSEAAAITSGAAALLLSQRPDLTPDQVKATMAGHAMWLPNLTTRDAGAGELDMGWVLNAPTENGVQTWPSAVVSNRTSPTINAPWSLTPSGSTWTGSTWTGSTWTGSTWTGSTWTGSMWQTQSWG